MPENDLLFVRQGTFVEEMVGWQDYNDLATQSTPLQMPDVGTWYTLPNDGLGPYTNTKYRVLGKPEIWRPETNSFYFGDLFLGGIHIIRVSLYVEPPSSNTEVEVRLRAAIGSSGEYAIPITSRLLKANRPYHVGITSFFTIDNEQTRDYPAQLEIMSDSSGCEVVVEGWKILTLDRF